MQRRVFLKTAAVGAMVHRTGYASTSDDYETYIDDLYNTAKKNDGHLTWYVSFLGTDEANMTADRFSSLFPGISIDVARTTTQVAFQRAKQDISAHNHMCDVFSTTNPSHYIDFKNNDELMQYVPKGDVNLVSEVQKLDPDGYFHTVDIGSTAYIYNTSLIKDTSMLDSWESVTDPRWRGKVALGHPAFSGYSGSWTLQMLHLYGESWLENLAKNKPHVGRSIIDTLTIVNSGQCDFGTQATQLTYIEKAKGGVVDVMIPKEGGVLMIVPSAIMKKAPHPHAAQLFMEFLNGSSEFDQLRTQEMFVMPKLSSSKSIKGMPSLDGDYKWLISTPEEMVNDLPEVVKMWRDIFGV